MALAETIDTLMRAPLFGLLDREALRLIGFSAETRKLRPGETLFRRGDRSDGGYVVLEGELEIRSARGEPVARAGPGSLVGQTALFVRMQRPSTAIASVLSNVLRVSPTLMRRILQEFPDGAAAIRDALDVELRDTAGRLEEIRRMLLLPGGAPDEETGPAGRA